MAKIMVVDDDKTFVDELTETLGLCGYETKGVLDSAEAPRLARKLKPQVILLDLRMNAMNGFRVAEALKGDPHTAAIPIIAMSGYFPIEKESVLLDLSKMTACIKKPFSDFDLISCIDRALGRDTAGIEEEIYPAMLTAR